MSFEVVNLAEFRSVMQGAIRTSSRSAATVINGKHQDLLYKAYDYTPISKPTRIETMHTPAAFITSMVTKYKARAVFKASMQPAKKAKTRFARIQAVHDGYRELWWKRINGKPIGRHFLQMGWVFAGKKFKRVNAERAGKVFAKPLSGGNRPIRVGIREAAGTSALQVSSCEIRWRALDKRPGDAAAKEAILLRALRRAFPAVVADTRRHLYEKHQKEMDKLSARGAR